MPKQRAGFTLTELLITLALMALLAGAAAVALTQLPRSGQEQAAQMAAQRLAAALNDYNRMAPPEQRIVSPGGDTLQGASHTSRIDGALYRLYLNGYESYDLSIRFDNAQSLLDALDRLEYLPAQGGTAPESYDPQLYGNWQAQE